MKHHCAIVFLLFSLLFSSQAFASSIPSDAHRARENKYDVNFYFLDLAIQDTSYSLSGNVMIRAHALSALDTFAVELDNTMTIDSAVAGLNGASYQAATVARSGTEINVLLPFTVAAAQYTEVRIYYHGTPTPSPNGFPLSGYFTGVNHRFSASPPYNSYTWWPCKQSLTDKADSSWFYITTDTSARGISNGVLNHVTAISPTQNRWEWRSHHAIDFYLISFIAGKFTETTQYFHPAGRTDSMQIQYYNYTPPFDSLVPTILQVYSKLFGLYPFFDEKFGIATVNLGGGMENQTIVSLGVGGVEAHETAHQWFGDNVTCGSWQDIMVNEGFARWCESLYPEFSGGGDSARIVHCNGYEASVFSNPHASGYSPADTATVIGVFGNEGLYYDKNAMMINSLRFVVNNDSLFFLGLRNYQTLYHAANGYGSTLRDVMENTTGIDLTGFFAQWYYGFGYPTYDLTWHQVGNELMLQVTETTSSPNTPLFTTPLELRLQGTNGDTTLRLSVTDSVVTFNIAVTGLDTSFVVDPNQWIANGHGTITEDTTLYVSGIRTLSAASAYKVYPNPASDYLFITSASSGPVDMTLFNELGQKVYSTHTSSNSTLHLPSLSDGLYTLQIDHGDCFKVVIEK